MLSQTAETSQNQQPGRIERSAIRSGKWVEMEELAQRIRRLARDLCSDKPLGEKGRFGTGISAVAATGNHSNPSKCDKFGFHLHKGSSGWNGLMRGTRRELWLWSLAICLLFCQRAIVKSLGTTIRNCTNSVIRLRGFFVASSVFPRLSKGYRKSTKSSGFPKILCY